MHARDTALEWPTLGLLVLCYTVWAVGVFWIAAWSPWAAVAVVAVAITLHSSLTHEIIHGHPTPHAAVNRSLVWPALGLAIPFERFRDQHLAHHMDARLTDPYDDPETNYLDASVWERLPRLAQAVLALNNTLAGRIVIGPLVGQVLFMASDARAVWRGNRAVAGAWLRHGPAVAAVMAVVVWAPMPVWAYLAAAYGALSILKIRTFLEHRAHDHTGARSVIIEDRGPLAVLFLNNNLHVVHHMHPAVPWYRLPTLYGAQKDRYRRRNHGYVYRSYREIFAQHLWRAKDPVAHPLWRRAEPLAEPPAEMARPASG